MSKLWWEMVEDVLFSATLTRYPIYELQTPFGVLTGSNLLIVEIHVSRYPGLHICCDGVRLSLLGLDLVHHVDLHNFERLEVLYEPLQLHSRLPGLDKQWITWRLHVAPAALSTAAFLECFMTHPARCIQVHLLDIGIFVLLLHLLHERLLLMC